MVTNIELYEVFKNKVGPEAAKMLAESMIAPAEVATKADLECLRSDLMRWMLGLMIPTWVAMLGIMAGMIGLFITRAR